MGKIIIINGSPRAPRSNSAKYSEIFREKCRSETEYYNVTGKNHLEICQALRGVSDVLLVFPLYADGIPVTLLNFLKTLEKNPPDSRPAVSVMINCGFLEPEQNDVAVEMVKLFAQKNGYPMGSVLKIGGGEAILGTPFRFLVVSKIKKLARSIDCRRPAVMKVTMPISKKMFLKASTAYWEDYGKRGGVTREEMDTMDIEK